MQQGQDRATRSHPASPADTGNDDNSGEPVGNRGAQPQPRPAGYEEEPGGGRGEGSGRNLEQLEQVRGKPGEPR